MIAQKSKITILGALFVCVILTSVSLAQDTLLISYQGRLTDDGGIPVTGTPSMTFTIYDEGSVSKWTETHPTVQVDEGLFNIILGSQTALPDSVFTGDDRYLGITVSGDPEISPRSLLTSAPGAAVAKRISGDIVTAPGSFVLNSDQGDSAIVFSTDEFSNEMTINWGIPPSIRPGISMFSGPGSNGMALNWGIPPSIRPVITFNATSTMANFTINRNIPPSIYPAFQIRSDDNSESIFMELSIPPSIMPAIKMSAETGVGASLHFYDEIGKVMGVEPTPFNEGISINFFDPQESENRVVIASNYITDESSLEFIDPDNAAIPPSIKIATSPAGPHFNLGLILSPYDMRPGVEMTTDVSSATMMMGSGPGAPQTVMSFITDNTEARIGIGTDSPTEPLVVGNNITSYPGTWAVIGDDTPGETTGLIIGESANSHSWLEWSVNGNSLSLGTRENTNWYSNTLNLKGGNIGINCTDASEPLVVGKDLGSFTGNRLVIGSDDVNINTGLEIGEHSDFRGYIHWRGDHNYLNIGTEEDGVLFDNSLTVRTGQVGIGTGTPLQTLDVRGTIGNASTVYHSDKRWKRDIKKLDASLERVLKLQGVQYKWKQDDYPEMNFPDGVQIGLIAQDVEKIIPEVVNEAADGYKSIDYAKLVSVLIESIKEQQEKIDRQEDHIKTLSERIDKLEGTKISSR